MLLVYKKTNPNLSINQVILAHLDVLFLHLSLSQKRTESPSNGSLEEDPLSPCGGEWFQPKMHQLQFKHLKKITTKIQKSYYLERVCTYPKWTPFTVIHLLFKLKNQHTCCTNMCHPSNSPRLIMGKIQRILHPKTQKPLVMVAEKHRQRGAFSIILPQRSSLTTQLLYHPATDQNKGTQLRRENGQFQQQEEVPLAANPSRDVRDCFGTKWGQETVGWCFFVPKEWENENQQQQGWWF